MHYVSDALDNLANLIGMHLSIPMALQTTLIAQLVAVNAPNVYIILFEIQFIEIIINHNGFFFDTKIGINSSIPKRKRNVYTYRCCM